MVILVVPVVAVPEAVNVSVEVALPFAGGVTGLVENVAVTPAGKPEALNVVAPDWMVSVTETVPLAVPPKGRGHPTPSVIDTVRVHGNEVHAVVDAQMACPLRTALVAMEMLWPIAVAAPNPTSTDLMSTEGVPPPHPAPTHKAATATA